ncbi:hypothetical protein COB55_00295 [Candidatus Wolfebacteria bacterium]|nr:MAG: hypothetical protein COB55_00295 [Candidatus Wolfebacteria bacterium]
MLGQNNLTQKKLKNAFKPFESKGSQIRLHACSEDVFLGSIEKIVYKKNTRIWVCFEWCTKRIPSRTGSERWERFGFRTRIRNRGCFRYFQTTLDIDVESIGNKNESTHRRTFETTLHEQGEFFVSWDTSNIDVRNDEIVIPPALQLEEC